jgi:hypothetical protein
MHCQYLSVLSYNIGALVSSHTTLRLNLKAAQGKQQKYHATGSSACSARWLMMMMIDDDDDDADADDAQTFHLFCCVLAQCSKSTVCMCKLLMLPSLPAASIRTDFHCKQYRAHNVLVPNVLIHLRQTLSAGACPSLAAGQSLAVLQQSSTATGCSIQYP